MLTSNYGLHVFKKTFTRTTKVHRAFSSNWTKSSVGCQIISMIRSNCRKKCRKIWKLSLVKQVLGIHLKWVSCKFPNFIKSKKNYSHLFSWIPFGCHVKGKTRQIWKMLDRSNITHVKDFLATTFRLRTLKDIWVLWSLFTLNVPFVVSSLTLNAKHGRRTFDTIVLIDLDPFTSSWWLIKY